MLLLLLLLLLWLSSTLVLLLDQRTRGPEDQRTGGPGDQGGRRTEDGSQGTRGPEARRTRGPEDQGTRGPKKKMPPQKKSPKKYLPFFKGRFGARARGTLTQSKESHNNICINMRQKHQLTSKQKQRKGP